MEVLINARNGEELLESLTSVEVDVAIIDIRMPVVDGFSTASLMNQRFPDVKVIALSQYDIETNIVKMFIYGVRSFVGKGTPEYATLMARSRNSDSFVCTFEN